jgi:hypothetical protein
MGLRLFGYYVQYVLREIIVSTSCGGGQLTDTKLVNEIPSLAQPVLGGSLVS